MDNLAEGKFGTGAAGHTIKSTDWIYNNLAPKSVIPFDWSEGYNVQADLRIYAKYSDLFSIPVKNQGVSFSCGGMAGAYYAEVLEAFKTRIFSEKSAKFIYAPIAVPGGGSWGYDIMNRVKKNGVAAEMLCRSYESSNPPSEAFMTKVEDITQEAIVNATFSESVSYSFIYSFDMDSLAEAIRDNKGVIILVRGTNNGTWLSQFPQPPSSMTPETIIWGHWAYAGRARMIEGKKHIGILNSWGEAVGDRGWQYLSEDYVNSGRIELAMVMSFGAPKSYQFAKDIYMGITDSDVYFLQKILNQNSLTQVATTGNGSPGKETYYFGQLTKNAVIRYQLSKGIFPAVGYLGVKTRASLNSL